MDSTEARRRGREIVDLLATNRAVPWRAIFDGDGDRPGYLQRLLAPVVFSVGEEAVRYATGNISGERPIGQITVVTDTVLVITDFHAAEDWSDENQHMFASVEVVARRRIAHAHVLQPADFCDESDSAWPSAVTIRLTIDGREEPVTLPTDEDGAKPDSATLAELFADFVR
jgi:hypothetical protein